MTFKQFKKLIISFKNLPKSKQIDGKHLVTVDNVSYLYSESALFIGYLTSCQDFKLNFNYDTDGEGFLPIEINKKPHVLIVHSLKGPAAFFAFTNSFNEYTCWDTKFYYVNGTRFDKQDALTAQKRSIKTNTLKTKLSVL